MYSTETKNAFWTFQCLILKLGIPPTNLSGSNTHKPANKNKITV